MKLILFITFIILVGCVEHSQLPISNTLELALGNKHSQYVKQLNKSCHHDNSALVDFLKINYISDAAGYDHGFIIHQLMKQCGDTEFLSALEKLTDKELDIVHQYLEVGVDANEKYRQEVKNNYPLSAEKMKINGSQ